MFPLGLYVAVAALLVACEYWLAFDRRWHTSVQGSLTDFTYVIVATALDKAAFVLCVGVVAAFGARIANATQIALWPRDWNIGLQVLLALAIADAGAYWRHRFFHKSDLLWRFHQIHHSMTELYWIRSAYTHPLEQLCILAAIMLPIAVLGAGAEIIAFVAFAFGLSGLLQHANVDSTSSLFNYLFATPEVHRVHHRADADLSHSNFSAFFVVMDHLFGTYRRPATVRGSVPFGLEGRPTFPDDFISHLAIPFRGDRTSGERGEGNECTGGNAR